MSDYVMGRQEGASSRSLLARIAESHCEMCLEPHRRDYSQCSEFQSVASCRGASMAKAPPQSEVCVWGEGLIPELQEQLMSEMSDYVMRRQEGASSGSLLARIAESRCEMCLEPHRRNYGQCGEHRNMTSCRGADKAKAPPQSEVVAWGEGLIPELQEQLMSEMSDYVMRRQEGE